MREKLGIAANGAGVWLLYAAIELWLFAVADWFIQPRSTYWSYNPAYSALFMIIAAATGAVMSLLCDAALSRSAAYRSASPVGRKSALEGANCILLLLLLQVVSFFVLENRSARSLAFYGAFALLTALIVAGRWMPQARLFTHAPVCLTTFLGMQWIPVTLQAFGINGQFGKLAGILAVGVLVPIAGKAGLRLWTSVENKPPRGFSSKAFAATASLAATPVILSAFLHAEPLRRAPASMPDPGPKPNVILIVMDTVRADHLSLYGYPLDTTPNLKKLANEATVYRHAVASAGMSLPSHASMFTGLYATRHGAHYAPDAPLGWPMSHNRVTLAELLSEKGFATAGIAANWGYITSFFGFDQGFEYYKQAPPPAVRRASGPFCSLRDVFLPLVRMLPDPARAQMRPAEDITAEALTVVDEMRARKRPFFLFLNYMDAHFPYIARAPFDKRFRVQGKLPTLPELAGIKERVLAAKENRLTAEEWADLVPRYDAGIAYLDASLGELFEQLRARGLFDNSLIIVTGDHGEAFGEKGEMEHGGLSVHQIQVGIPLIVKYPNSRQAESVQTPVSHVDFLPTVFDVLGYQIPPNLDGVSLRTVGEHPDRSVFAESFPGQFPMAVNPDRFRWPTKAVVHGTMKYISSDGGAHELFDLDRDPQENRNVLREQAQVSEQLAVMLEGWRKSHAQEGGQSPAGADPAAIERLKSLGYVGGK